MLHKKYILEYIGYINGTLMNSQKSCEFIKIPLKKSVGGSFVIHFMLIVLATHQYKNIEAGFVDDIGFRSPFAVTLP